MKIISWNVNGIRAIVKKDFFKSLEEIDADIVCLQETKAQEDQVQEALFGSGYDVYAYSAEKKGYSSTAILTRGITPLSITKGLGIEKHDNEGRVITAEFEGFYVVTAYVPNSKGGLVRLPYRQEWDADLLAHCNALQAKKPVILNGDMNACHQAIDIARPEANYNKSPGYTQQEIDGMTNFISAGLIDSFRHFYPDKVKYSWWSYRGGAREKNVGWRLDYMLVSKPLMPKVKDAFILNEHLGSDHCPVGLELA
ncbi:MAG: exodeoxyribonuclease III [Flavobacteriales bacterium]